MRWGRTNDARWDFLSCAPASSNDVGNKNARQGHAHPTAESGRDTLLSRMEKLMSYTEGLSYGGQQTSGVGGRTKDVWCYRALIVVRFDGEDLETYGHFLPITVPPWRGHLRGEPRGRSSSWANRAQQIRNREAVKPRKRRAGRSTRAKVNVRGWEWRLAPGGWVVAACC